jgi:hypothetical protein
MHDSKRQINPIVEVAGAQWLVYEWDELQDDPEGRLTLVLYRLTAEERQLVARNNVDWETWTSAHHAVSMRFNIPRPPPMDIEESLDDE